jgi:hypothetical protein
MILTSGMLVAMGAASPVFAQPTADQLLTDMGLSDGDKQRVLNGEFVSVNLAPVSPRDLSIAIAFLVKTSPDALAKEITSGALLAGDPQLKASGEFHGKGSPADLAGLPIDADATSKLASASAGSALNLSTAEIAAFKATEGSAPAVATQLRQTLLVRYQAYESTGLAGILPYDRGGSTSDPADDLKKASQASAGLKKYLPSLQNVLLNYPNEKAAGISAKSRWFKYDISGTVTYVLSQSLSMSDGDARAIVSRQYYVSTGYNAEQAVAGLVPVQNATVVVYTNHTFTDQVTGWGGSAKVSIGRRMMEGKLQDIFDADRKKVAH